MAATPSLKIEKTIEFKGGVRLWSNRYHFNGGTPADAAHWHTLMDAVTDAEKACYASSVTIVNALGYAAGSDVPVAEKAYAISGTTGPTAGSWQQAGEVCALVRYSTAARTTKNHPIYLFNYYHGCFVLDSLSDADHLDTAHRTAFGTYGAAWIAGFTDGVITAVRASPNGAAATGVDVEEMVTHRDFPYTTSV